MYKRILVGTDGSPTAAKAVERAVEVAKATGASLTIFSAGGKEQAQAVVDEAAKAHGNAGVELDTKIASGDAASALVEESEGGDYDLLVLGNKGMTGAGRFFLGSVPNKVSHHITRSLLIVRTT